MVVFEDGLPKKSEYRRFKLKGVDGNDDFAAMEEVLTRRLTAYLAERRRPVSEREGKFQYPPQLLLVDGGKGQLGVAVRVLSQLGLDEEIPTASLAKRFEEVFVPGPGRPDPPAPPVRGALPAPAGAGRVAPLRHRLPPQPAGQADDDELGARGRARPRARPGASGW